MRLIVAGSRNFFDYNFVKNSIKTFVEEKNITISEIVSGNANGVDKLGEQYAEEYTIPTILFPAKWKQYGKSAGPRRNKEMAAYGDYLIVFWDMQSRGTRNMIDCMITEKKPYTIIKIN